ncbi:YesK family protein [Oceanobacillus neutriphilus]|uniref:YesK-like protein n=1 Tax=Oceanobacillus neutriphilus TaxID=531815 RepID=A0ABQ2P2R1_9BACI|nr:YesK family protein [Oceanobacillus neutriphilus]GGP16867.1 hypothetical protein GCM10011346_50540 [Oceanobacillus neutriphilus]
MDGRMEGFMEFFMYIIGIGIVIFLLSMLLKKKKIILPYVTCGLSILSIFISLFIGGWEGLGLGYISFCTLIASVINILIISIFMKNKLSDNQESGK